MELNEQAFIPLNGALQYISVRAEKKGAPLLLYLHGGPGDAALPLVLKFNRELEKHFTVVVWEQRGAGKSYYRFGDEQPSIDTFLQDLYALVSALLARFEQRDLYLVAIRGGACWGCGSFRSTRSWCAFTWAAAKW